MTSTEIISYCKKWEKERNFTFHPYQIKTILTIFNHFNTDLKPVVLAASPGAGKTLMSIIFIHIYLKINPGAKILVLTHGTSILKNQYIENISKYKSTFIWNVITENNNYTELLYDNNDVIISLPQAIHRKKLGKFDLIIVDEAHQFYYTDYKIDDNMIETIIKKIKPQNELLLTGTPTDFVLKKEKYNIITIPLTLLLKIGQARDVKISLADASYDYNIDKDINLINRLQYMLYQILKHY
jgi:superfamily II DNA or RNA helicase